MKDRKIEFESEGWVKTNEAVRRLFAAGYSVSSYNDKGTTFYALHRNPVGYNEPQRYELLLESTNPEEINNMVKLLIPPED